MGQWEVVTSKHHLSVINAGILNFYFEQNKKYLKNN